MTDEFDITLNYKGQNINLATQLLLQGHTHKFKVLINETEFFFEPDEEGHYRAVRMPWQQARDLEKIDRELLSAVAQQIETILS